MPTWTQREELPDLPFRRYRAVPKEVRAVQWQQPMQVANPFATDVYRGKAGDWQITYGVRKDGTPDVAICDGEVFARTYEQIEGDRYQKKAQIEIDAAQLQAPLDVITMEGPAHGEPGDWLLIGVEGEPYFNDDSYFRSRYQPIDEPPGN